MFEKINKWFSKSEKEYELVQQDNKLDVDTTTISELDLKMNKVAIHYNVDIDILTNYCKYNNIPRFYTKGSIGFKSIYSRITGIKNTKVFERTRKIEKIMGNIKNKNV